MTHELVGGFDAPTAPWIAPAAELLGSRSAPVLLQRVPTIRYRFCGFVCLRLHTSQAPQDEAHFAQREPGHGGFDPFDGLHRYAIVGFGHPMEVLGTVVGIEPLPGLGKQRLDVFPYPLGSITDDAQAHLLFRYHASLFDLLEGLAEWLLILHLMPTQQMDDAITIKEGEAKALRIAPLAVPQRPLGTGSALAGPASPGTLGPRGHIRPINAQYQHWTATTVGSH